MSMTNLGFNVGNSLLSDSKLSYSNQNNKLLQKTDYQSQQKSQLMVIKPMIRSKQELRQTSYCRISKHQGLKQQKSNSNIVNQMIQSNTSIRSIKTKEAQTRYLNMAFKELRKSDQTNSIVNKRFKRLRKVEIQDVDDLKSQNIAPNISPDDKSDSQLSPYEALPNIEILKTNATFGMQMQSKQTNFKPNSSSAEEDDIDKNITDSADVVYGFTAGPTIMKKPTRPATQTQSPVNRLQNSQNTTQRGEFWQNTKIFNKTAQSNFNKQQNFAKKRQRSVHQQQLINDLISKKVTNTDFTQNLQMNRIQHEIKKQHTGSAVFGITNPYDAPNLQHISNLNPQKIQITRAANQSHSASCNQQVVSGRSIGEQEVGRGYGHEDMPLEQQSQSEQQSIQRSSSVQVLLGRCNNYSYFETRGNNQANETVLDNDQQLWANQSVKVFDSRHSHILQEQSVMQASLRDFRERAEGQEQLGRAGLGGDSVRGQELRGQASLMRGQSATGVAYGGDRSSILDGKSQMIVQKLQVMGQYYRFNDIVKAFVQNLITLCCSQPAHSSQKEALSHWPKEFLEIAKKQKKYTDEKSELIIQQLGEEFKIIQNGILQLIRSKLRNERKYLNDQLQAFRAVRQQGLHPDTIAALIQEIKDRLPNPACFNERQLDNESDQEHDQSDCKTQSLRLESQLTSQLTQNGQNHQKQKKKPMQISSLQGATDQQKIGRHEMMRTYKGLIEETVAVLIKDQECQEKIKQINQQINDSEETAELNLLEEMLEQHYQQLQFQEDYFLAKDTVKNFKRDLTNISDFLLKNESKVKSALKPKVWKAERYNFNRRNPMCENIRQFS